MQDDPGGGAQDEEPESTRSGTAPPKKPLAQFLAEFERRLLDHPEESATSALQVVEDRAGGRRRAGTPNVATRGPSPQHSDPGASATATPPANLSPPPTVALPGTLAAPGTPGSQAEAEEAAAPEAPEAPETTAETRKVRGRRRRRHRHRAH